MKKKLSIILCLTLLLSVALMGCNSSAKPVEKAPEDEEVVVTNPPEVEPSVEEQPSDGLSGSAQEVLEQLLTASDFDFGMVEDYAVTEENTASMLGLTPEEFSQNVEEAHVSTGALTTSAHLVAVIKCNDSAAANHVKDLVAGGFDSGRWICVFPQESFVVEAGDYVLLVASREEGAAALKDAFDTMAGESVGNVNVFFSAGA